MTSEASASKRDNESECLRRLESVSLRAALVRVQCRFCAYYSHDPNSVDWCDLQDVNVDPFGWCYRFWDKVMRLD